MALDLRTLGERGSERGPGAALMSVCPPRARAMTRAAMGARGPATPSEWRAGDILGVFLAAGDRAYMEPGPALSASSASAWGRRGA